ncbi:MAG: tetratricopeptide repeat protein [Bacteroidota bacterium]
MNQLKAYCIGLLSLFPLMGSKAYAQADALFDQANQAFQAEQYAEAVALYDSILGMNLSSRDLHYNLGNAHYRLGHVAPAILHYERALSFDPDAEDVLHNLRLANLRIADNLKAAPELFFVAWWRNLYQGRTSGQWSGWAVGFLWLALIGGVVFLLVNQTMAKRLGFFGGIVALVFSLVLLFISSQRMSLEQDSQAAIIFSENVYVKDAPAGKTDLIILHEGVKVALMDEVNGWAKIRVEDSNIGKVEGWIETDTYEKI